LKLLAINEQRDSIRQPMARTGLTVTTNENKDPKANLPLNFEEDKGTYEMRN